MSLSGPTSRRALLGGMAVTALAGRSEAEPRQTAERRIETDVLVVGGGTAGTIAAVAAGRCGARTVLVEAGSQLGGTMTTGGVEWPGLFFAWGRQVVAGIGWELVRATVELQGDPLPDFDKSVGEAMHRHPNFQVHLCGGLYAAVAEEACTKAGVALRYYESPASVVADDEGWLVTTVGKGVRATIRCQQIVDCTANASVVDLAGFERRRGEDRQPGSIVYTLTQPSGWKSGPGYKHQRYVLGADVTTAESHTDANIRGRAAFLKAFRALKASPEGKDVKVLSVQPETNSRETWRIVGEYEITRDDYASGRVHDDAVACMYYPIDLHTPDGVKPQHLPERTTVTIPLRALIPRGSRNLLVAGRCVSSDRLANSGLRVQASCMAMGQAAGTAAALAARQRLTPAAVALPDLRAELARQGAILPA